MSQGIFLSLGTNMGNKAFNLNQASKLIAIFALITKKSSLYSTGAWGNTDQPSFYNQIIEVDTALRPEVLLERLLSVEHELGRIREERWGPRIIDIDILFYHDKIIQSENLTIPHPGIASRRFVLAPLAEINPGFRHPVLQKSIEQLLAECTDLLFVEKISS